MLNVFIKIFSFVPFVVSLIWLYVSLFKKKPLRKSELVSVIMLAITTLAWGVFTLTVEF